MSQRRDYIDELKGFGILLVVCGHFTEQYRMNFPLVSALFFCIYAFHMALFCACSGLVARFNPRKLITQQLWLYLAAQALMFVFRAVVLRENFAETGGVFAALLLPWRHMWYLYALIFWHLTLPLLTWLRDKFRLPGACLGLALAVAVALAAGLVSWPFTLVRVFSFFPFYAFGVLFRPQLDKLAGFAAGHTAFRRAVAAVLAACYGVYFLRILLADSVMDNSAQLFHDVSYAEGDSVGYRLVFYLVGIITTAALVALAGSWHRFSALGRQTLAIYLLHLPILALFVELRLFEPLREGPAVLALLWALLLGGGTLCVLRTAPVQKAFDTLANWWYKK